MTPLKAIRAKCLDCCGTASEVKACPCVGCTLYPYRFGKRPVNAGNGCFAPKTPSKLGGFETNLISEG